MSEAVLDVRRRPDLGVGMVLIRLDCEHHCVEGLLLLPEPPPPAIEWRSVRHLLVSHAAHTGCCCTRRLRRRYGLER